MWRYVGAGGVVRDECVFLVLLLSKGLFSHLFYCTLLPQLTALLQPRHNDQLPMYSLKGQRMSPPGLKPYIKVRERSRALAG